MNPNPYSGTGQRHFPQVPQPTPVISPRVTMGNNYSGPQVRLSGIQIRHYTDSDIRNYFTGMGADGRVRTYSSGSSSSTENGSGSSSSLSSAGCHHRNRTPAPHIELGDLVQLPIDSDIRSALECPVCKEISLPPIWNCASGHTTCSACRPKLTECALCKSSFSDSRNYGLESLVLRSKFHCHYKDRGCAELIYGDEFKDHLRKCISRPGAVVRHDEGACGTSSSSTQQPCTSRSRIRLISSESETGDSESDFSVLAWYRFRNGNYPDNAIIAGTTASGHPIIVARAYEGDQLHPGRLNPTEFAAFIYCNGQSRRKWYYDVLVGVPDTYKWVDASWGDIPTSAVHVRFDANQDQSGPTTQFIGRALQNGLYHPGFIQRGSQGCVVGVEDELYLCHDYQVLVRDA